MDPSRRLLLARLGAVVVRVGHAIGRRRPLRSDVVLASQGSRQLGGNLAAIRAGLAARQPRIPVTVLAWRRATGRLSGLFDAWHLLRAGYLLATARLFVVDEWFFPMDVIRPRPGTSRVQVWHAAGALKRFGYSALAGSFGPDATLIRAFKLHGNYDLCLTSSRLATDHYVDAFRLPRDRFTSALGVPRTDLFFDPHRVARADEAIRKHYDLPPTRQVLLYAPTFRGSSVRAARHLDALDLGIMRDTLADGWTLLLRPHPLVRDSLVIEPDLRDFVRDVSDWPDMNELLVVADMLVTDYSSAVFEYALLDRPMAFFAPDLGPYGSDRGLYIDYRAEMPGPIFETTSDLAAYVRDGPLDATRVRDFAARWFDIADGHATTRFIDRVVRPALDGKPPRVEVEPRPEDRRLAAPVTPRSRSSGPSA